MRNPRLEKALPNRPRSHQLEDASITHFKSILPEAWVCREKDRDYGVDLEIEIFDERGDATGLMFYAQLKATDDPDRETKAVIPVDRIRYLQSLDAPSILVRYSSHTKRVYWQWAFSALDKPNNDNVSATITFANLWTPDTPLQVLNVIRKMRRLRAADRNEKFPIRLVHNVPPSRALICQSALTKVISHLPFLSQVSGDPSSLELTIEFSEASTRIALEPIGFLEIPVTNANDEAFMKRLLAFALASVFTRMGFAERATAAARICLTTDGSSGDLPDELILNACLALLIDPQAAVDLATKNQLHHPSHRCHAAFITSLLSWRGDGDELSYALQYFYRSAIAAAKYLGINPGNLHYSLGNSLNGNGKHRAAVAEFNAARKHRPLYTEADYYLRELGGSLFLSGKFKCSASVYRRALSASYDKKTAFCLGDALFFSADYSAAIETLKQIDLEATDPFDAETRLKIDLALWLVDAGYRGRPADLFLVLQFAKEAHDEGRTVDCFWASLLAAFVASSNTELWSWAIHFATIALPRQTLEDVMTCSEACTGLDGYTNFRMRIFNATADESVISEFDVMSLEVHSKVQSRARAPSRARLLFEDRTETFEFS